MDIFSAYSAESMNDDEQNNRLNLLEEKIDLIANFLSINFEKIKITEKYKNWLGKEKERTKDKLIIK
jgi:hypothetical protein